MNSVSIALRSVAHHERSHKGNVELAGIIDSAADEIERLRSELQRIAGFKTEGEADDANTCADIALNALAPSNDDGTQPAQGGALS